jgi:hypothetical protein
MPSVEQILAQMRVQPAAVHFADLKKLCEAYFVKPRQSGSSHIIYKTPWPGDPRVNIQNAKGKAKPYHVRQVLTAIEQMEQHMGQKMGQKMGHLRQSRKDKS